jgi:cytochrome c oxidase subunit 3
MRSSAGAPRAAAIAPARPDDHGTARFGFILFLASESMVFGGLIAALLVLRLNADRWPPIGLPRLPVAITAINSLVLFASCWPMSRALSAARRGDAAGLRRSLGAAAALGVLFLAVQGSEWIRLLAAGLGASSGPYGATFFTLIGCHAFHVLGAVVWLCVLWIGSHRGRFAAPPHLAIDLGTIYWYYVSLVWVVVYPCVYLKLV